MKAEREFAPVHEIPFTPAEPPLDGLDERIITTAGKPGVVTRMLRFAPGLDTSRNGTLTHDFWEEVYIIDGSFFDLTLGKTFKAGDFAIRPPGMRHGPWRTDEGVTTFESRYYSR